MPVVPTLALVLLLVQLPPPVASLSEVVEPAQTVGVPVMASGKEFTVTAEVTKHAGPDM